LLNRFLLVRGRLRRVKRARLRRGNGDRVFPRQLRSARRILHVVPAATASSPWTGIIQPHQQRDPSVGGDHRGQNRPRGSASRQQQRRDDRDVPQERGEEGRSEAPAD